MKHSVELIYNGNRRWVRFPNADRQLLDADSSYAVVYHSKNSEVVRVMARYFVKDFSLQELLPRGGSWFAYTKALYAALKELGLTAVEFYSDDEEFVEYLNQRTPTVGREREFLLRGILKPTITAFSKFSVGGERQLQKIASLRGDFLRIKRHAHGILWDILNDEA